MCAVVHGRVPRRAGADAKAAPSPATAIIVVIVIVVAAEVPLEGVEQLLVLEILRREGLVQPRKGRVVGRDGGFPLLGPVVW